MTNETNRYKQPKSWWCDFCFEETMNGPICEICEVQQLKGVKT